MLGKKVVATLWGTHRWKKLGIDPERLSWQAMPAPSFDPVPPTKEDDEADFQPAAGRPLTMAEAKKGLALTFNVPASSIEITIRG